MTDLAAVFDEAIKTVLWPSFKAMGYKKRGNNFRYYSPEGWGKIVQLQKSRWNSAEELSFTVNIGLYLPEVDYYICGRESSTNFDESSCVVRKRLGNLKPSQRDEWHILSDTTDTEQLFTNLNQDFSQYILPFLAPITSRESIYRILVAGHRSHYIRPQIEAMYRAGYEQAATALLINEVAHSKPNHPYQATLRALAQRLNISIEQWPTAP